MNDIPENSLEQIKKIFADTIAAFTSFNLATNWHVGNAWIHVHACYNYGCNDHLVPKCPKPKNPKLNKNKEAYCQSRLDTGGSKDQIPKTSWNGYTHVTFGPPKPGKSILQSNGVWHGHYSLYNWNTSHTTHFYDEWNKDKVFFTVPDSHPLASMVRKYGNHPISHGDRHNNQNCRKLKGNGTRPDDGLKELEWDVRGSTQLLSGSGVFTNFQGNKHCH